MNIHYTQHATVLRSKTLKLLASPPTESLTFYGNPRFFNIVRLATIITDVKNNSGKHFFDTAILRIAELYTTDAGLQNGYSVAGWQYVVNTGDAATGLSMMSKDYEQNRMSSLFFIRFAALLSEMGQNQKAASVIARAKNESKCPAATFLTHSVVDETLAHSNGTNRMDVERLTKDTLSLLLKTWKQHKLVFGRPRLNRLCNLCQSLISDDILTSHDIMSVWMELLQETRRYATAKKFAERFKSRKREILYSIAVQEKRWSEAADASADVFMEQFYMALAGDTDLRSRVLALKQWQTKQPPLQAYILRWLAIFERADKRTETAVDLFKMSLHVFENDLTRFQLALTLHAVRDNTQAKTILQQSKDQTYPGLLQSLFYYLGFQTKFTWQNLPFTFNRMSSTLPEYELWLRLVYLRCSIEKKRVDTIRPQLEDFHIEATDQTPNRANCNIKLQTVFRGYPQGDDFARLTADLFSKTRNRTQ